MQGSVQLGSVAGPKDDLETVRRVLTTRLGGLRACYEHALRTDPYRAGKLRVILPIDTLGRVGEVKVTVKVTVMDAQGLLTCMTLKLQRLHLPITPASPVMYGFTLDLRVQ